MGNAISFDIIDNVNKKQIKTKRRKYMTNINKTTKALENVINKEATKKDFDILLERKETNEKLAKSVENAKFL